MSCREAAAKSRTGPSVKNTENIVPAACTVCGTPAAVSAWLTVVPGAAWNRLEISRSVA